MYNVLNSIFEPFRPLYIPFKIFVIYLKIFWDNHIITMKGLILSDDYFR